MYIQLSLFDDVMELGCKHASMDEIELSVPGGIGIRLFRI